MDEKVINEVTTKVSQAYEALEQIKASYDSEIEEILTVFSEQDAALESARIRKALKATAKAIAKGKIAEFDHDLRAVNDVRELQVAVFKQQELFAPEKN